MKHLSASSAVVCPTFEAYRAARDAGNTKEARRLLGELVAKWEPLLLKLVKKSGPSNHDADDLLQSARMELVRAIDKYEPSIGGFVAYVTTRVRVAMARDVIAVRPIVPPTGKKRAVWGYGMPKAVRLADQAFAARHGRQATSEDLGVDAEDLDAWRSRTHCDSYSEVVDEETGPCAGALAAAMTDTHHALSKVVRRTIGDMTPQEQRVLLSRIIEELDFEVIGANEGILRLTTWRIYEKAIGKLRVALNTNS